MNGLLSYCWDDIPALGLHSLKSLSTPLDLLNEMVIHMLKTGDLYIHKLSNTLNCSSGISKYDLKSCLKESPFLKSFD